MLANVRRLLCTEILPKIRIPRKHPSIELKFSRSSGPGGQNVNKLNTKAELRLNMNEAEWIPEDVKERLEVSESGRMNKDGEMIIRCDEKRSQKQNVDICFVKLREIILNSWMEPKEREQWTGLGEVTKIKRRQMKRRRSEVKSARRGGKDQDSSYF